MNCSLVITLDDVEKDKLFSETEGVITDLICRVPLAFAKERIYHEFITADRVTFPGLKVECSLFGSEEEKIGVFSTFNPDCRSVGGSWECFPGMRGTQGLGVIGRAVEKYVNNSKKIAEDMTDALTSLQQEK